MFDKLIFIQLLIIIFGSVWIYFKIKFILCKIKMKCEELIEQLSDGKDNDVGEVNNDHLKQRLSALISGGKSIQYFGKDITLSQLDELPNEQILKLYNIYESRLGTSMTKTLGNTILNMYAVLAGKVLPIPEENHTKLVSDLEDDPFVEHALTSTCCELYFRFGAFLAPITAMITTIKYCEFKNKNNINKNNGEQSTDT
jgi:hypothetical protein